MGWDGRLSRLLRLLRAPDGAKKKTDDLVHKGFPHAVCFPSILGKWEFTIELQGFQPIVKVVKRENASFFHLSASLPS